MKLKPFDRFVNVVLMLCIIALCAYCCGVAWGLLDKGPFTWFADALTSGVLAAILTTAAALIIAILCVRVMFVRQKDRTVDTAPKSPGILVRKGESGAVFLTLSALEEIVLRNVRINTRVRDCRCELLPGDGSVNVRIIASLTPDAGIPEVTAAVQDAVKTNVEATCGISVPEVQFVVEKAAPAASLTETKSRVL